MGYKILIVDDNNDFRKLIKQHISEQDANVDFCEADSGDSAIEEAKVKKPNMVLMDIRLPKVNGIIAAYQIKEEFPKTDIVILTMFNTEEYKRLARYAHITDFIGKSDVYDRLMPVIRKCMRGRLNYAKNK